MGVGFILLFFGGGGGYVLYLALSDKEKAEASKNWSSLERSFLRKSRR
jgi:hypothetical protein